MRSSLLAAVAVWLSACQAPIARDVEVQLDVGPERVVVEGVFRDLRLQRDDPVLAFRQVALLREEAGLELSRLGRVTRWSLVEREGRLDLELAGTVTRRQWDACLGWKPGDDKAPCEGLFVVSRVDGGLLFHVTPLVNVYAFPKDFEPRVKRTEGKFTYRLVWKEPRDEVSALPAWRALEEDVGGATRLAAWMKQVDDPALDSPPLDVLPEVSSLHLRDVATRFRTRVRQRVLFEALVDSKVFVPQPPDVALLGRLGQRTPFLSKPLPKPLSRSLERAYMAVSSEPEKADVLFREGCKGTWAGEAKALCRMLVTPR